VVMPLVFVLACRFVLEGGRTNSSSLQTSLHHLFL
jgi:hypothetical protein